MFKIASWNVNSLPVRLPQVLDWLKTSQVDVLALQETKVIDEKFPIEAIRSLGLHCVYGGQKTYNGVAVISRYPIEEVVMDMPDFIDEQKRILAVTIKGIRIINVYVPNGASVDSDKYQYKLNWLIALTAFIKQQVMTFPNTVILGDFNIAPEDRDVYAPDEWLGNVLVSPLERAAFFNLLSLGFVDSFRLFNQPEGAYSWWDYRQAGFRRNRGLRIDHILLSQPLKTLCQQSVIDTFPRKNERPSDHAPVWVALAL